MGVIVNSSGEDLFTMYIKSPQCTPWISDSLLLIVPVKIRPDGSGHTTAAPLSSVPLRKGNVSDTFWVFLHPYSYSPHWISILEHGQMILILNVKYATKNSCSGQTRSLPWTFLGKEEMCSLQFLTSYVAGNNTIELAGVSVKPLNEKENPPSLVNPLSVAGVTDHPVACSSHQSAHPPWLFFSSSFFMGKYM